MTNPLATVLVVGDEVRSIEAIPRVLSHAFEVIGARNDLGGFLREVCDELRATLGPDKRVRTLEPVLFDRKTLRTPRALDRFVREHLGVVECDGAVDDRRHGRIACVARIRHGVAVSRILQAAPETLLSGIQIKDQSSGGGCYRIARFSCRASLITRARPLVLWLVSGCRAAAFLDRSPTRRGRSRSTARRCRSRVARLMYCMIRMSAVDGSTKSRSGRAVNCWSVCRRSVRAVSRSPSADAAASPEDLVEGNCGNLRVLDGSCRLPASCWVLSPLLFSS